MTARRITLTLVCYGLGALTGIHVEAATLVDIATVVALFAAGAAALWLLDHYATPASESLERPLTVIRAPHRWPRTVHDLMCDPGDCVCGIDGGMDECEHCGRVDILHRLEHGDVWVDLCWKCVSLTDLGRVLIADGEGDAIPPRGGAA